MPLADEINLPQLRWIFPDAPFPFPDLLGGKMWFGSSAGNSSGIITSRELLLDLLDNLIGDDHLIPNKIALLGFSQGAVMGLDVGVRYPSRLGTLVALSGFLAQPEKLSKEKSPASGNMPILLAHGTEDEIVNVEGSRHAQNKLLKAGYSAELQEYPMGHQIITEEIKLIRDHLITQLCLL